MGALLPVGREHDPAGDGPGDISGDTRGHCSHTHAVGGSRQPGCRIHHPRLGSSSHPRCSHQDTPARGKGGMAGRACAIPPPPPNGADGGASALGRPALPWHGAGGAPPGSSPRGDKPQRLDFPDNTGRAELCVSAHAAAGLGAEIRGASRKSWLVGRGGTMGAEPWALMANPSGGGMPGCGGSARSPEGSTCCLSSRRAGVCGWNFIPGWWSPRQVTALPLPSLPLPSVFTQQVSYLQRGFAALFQASCWFRPDGGALGQRCWTRL